MKTLSDIMEFDHVIEVHEDGSITDRSDLYAPVLIDGEMVSDRWELLAGYSGQDRYSGPIMHESEFIGGGMEHEIRNTPGVYVAIIAESSVEDESNESTPEGWAVARLKDGS